MPSNAKASTASGQPAYLENPTMPGVESTPRLPQADMQQYPLAPNLQGLNAALNPVLAMAGAYYNARGYLVRNTIQIAGASRQLADGREQWPVRNVERHGTEPGMSEGDARLRGLDWYSPQYGWVRGGVKLEREHPENMGTGNTLDGVEWVDAEADAASREV